MMFGPLHAEECLCMPRALMRSTCHDLITRSGLVYWHCSGNALLACSVPCPCSPCLLGPEARGRVPQDQNAKRGAFCIPTRQP